MQGDGIRLARAVGGAVAHLPATGVPMLPGWPTDTGVGYAYGPDYAMPHSMIVDRHGNRFCDDSYWVDIVEKTHRPGRPAPAVLPRLRRAAPPEVRPRRHPAGR